MQTSTSSIIAPETTSTPGYSSQTTPLTPTDAAVAAGIHNLQAQGLTVVMKPQVDSLDGVFRGSLAPVDVAGWFASYQTFLLHYAALATQNNVGYLIIGTELKSLSSAAYVTYWNSMIAQVRTSYPSLTLIYGANATGANDEFTSVSFWSKVDIIGVDGYFPLTNHADPTVAQLVAAWTNNRFGFNIVAALQALQAQYGKPLIFTEIGYVSATGTNEVPYANAAAGAAYDPIEQQNCYEAFFQVFSQQTAWMKGVFWWEWAVSAPGSADTGYTGQNKPAAMVTLPKWFGSTTQGFTLAPSTGILAVSAGSSVSNTIAVTNQGGFTGAVSLAATGLPTGVSALFTAGSVAGTQTLTLTAGSGVASSQAAVTITGTSGTFTGSAPVALTVQSLPSQTITFTNPGMQIVGTPLTLTSTSTSGLAVALTSATTSVCTVSGTTATFLATGTCTINANQAGNASNAAALQVTQSFTVNPAPGLSLSATSTTLSFPAGNSLNDLVSVTSLGGMSGPVSLSAVITSSPQGAQNLPVLSFSPSTVNVTITSAGSTTFTVSSTAATSAMSAPAGSLWATSGPATLAALLLGFSIRRRIRPSWSRLAGLACLIVAAQCLVGCSSGSNAAVGKSGTTSGTYAITLTATSGTVTSTLPITVIVQ